LSKWIPNQQLAGRYSFTGCFSGATRYVGIACGGVKLRRYTLILALGVAITQPVVCLWAQGGSEGADAQQKTALGDAFGLPQAMTGNDFAVAIDRMRAATFADKVPVAPLHLRYELKMLDAKGKEHAGTYETWSTPEASRTEIHTDTYNGVEILKDNQRWIKEDGLRPLRVMEFMEEQALPKEAIVRSLSGAPKLKPRKANGVTLLCGGNGQSALICLDPSSGFIIFGTVDGETVDYSTWRKLGWRYLAGEVQITRLEKMLVDAKMTVASGAVPPDVFAIPEEAVESNASTDATRGAEGLGFVGAFAMEPLGPDKTNVGLDSSGKHRLLTRGGYGNVFPHSSGKAQVKVWVDERGRVTKAVLEDADDMDVADAALASARGATYAPEQENGHPVGFQTAYFFSISVAEVVFQ
jgi:hypothetical protein